MTALSKLINQASSAGSAGGQAIDLYEGRNILSQAVNTGMSPSQLVASSGGRYSQADLDGWVNQHAPEYKSWASGNTPPPTGLKGSELALDQGLYSALGSGQQGADDAIALLEKAGMMGLDGINSGVNSATGRLQPFVDDGRAATDRLKQFLGLGGPGTQQQAFDDFQMSPYAKFMQSEGEKGVLRNASATGNLGAGSTSKDLMRFNQGLASSELNNLMERLGFMSQSGQSAAGSQAGIDMQGVGLSTGLIDSFGRTGAGIRQTQGRDAANYGFNYGLNKSNNRFRTGELMADRIAQTTDNLTGIQDGEASSIGDLVIDSSGNLSSTFQRLGEITGLNQQQLMTLIANISTGSASQVAGLPTVPGVQEQDGALGRILEAIGTTMSA